jgi:biopolymer transport protein ExbD
MRFEMDSGGNILYQNTRMNFPGAERELRAALAGHPNLAVVLSIDGEAPWQQVVLFVELAQKRQVDSFSFNLKGNP